MGRRFRDMSPSYVLEARELERAEAEGPDRVPPEPRPAAGVVLARQRPGGPEVLLVRRRSDMGFAAGAYVFPGGTVDAEDADPEWERWLVMPSEDALAGVMDDGEPADDSGSAEDGQPANDGELPARAFVVAALREAFEETGVVLAVGSAGAELVTELASERAALVAGERDFLEIVREAELRLAGDRLVLCARWITPESLSRRYDARFFLAEAPAGVEITHESGELVEEIWIRPAEALELYLDERFPMLFPTARTLVWLAESGSSLERWRERFLHARVEPILPRLRRVGGRVISVIPGEPGYDEMEGDG